MDISIFILALASYLTGSIPTGVWVSKLFFGFDIRTKGSGNTGSTNIFRVLGKKWGIIVQLFDILKGVLPVTVYVNVIASDTAMFGLSAGTSGVLLQILAGVSAIIGHIFPVFARFKGGKGVNTMLGMLLGIMPIDALAGLSIFVIVLILSGYVSLGSMTAITVVSLSLLFRKFVLGHDIPGFQILLGYSLVAAALLFITHRSNIKRLAAGTENRFEKVMIFRNKKPRTETEDEKT